MPDFKLFLSLMLALVISFPLARAASLDNQTIYANPDGSYTYRDKSYSLDKFPLELVLGEITGGDSAPYTDSVVPLTVNIFPVESVNIHDLRSLVRPLALKFHRKGIKVKTRFLNKIIPYIFRSRKN